MYIYILELGRLFVGVGVCVRVFFFAVEISIPKELTFHNCQKKEKKKNTHTEIVVVVVNPVTQIEKKWPK